MLLQTNSYIVPADKRAEHARLLRRFRQVLTRLGCDNFEVYEQVGSNWNTAETSGRVVQIMRFRDRRHQLAVQAAERNDPAAQAIIAEFCNLINFPYQQQQGLFAVGFYNNLLAARVQETPSPEASAAGPAEVAAAATAVGASVLVEAPGEAAAPAAGVDAPATEDHIFAEGTEGIIAAAEQLSDEALDAGGDAAVADAIAGPEAIAAPEAVAVPTTGHDAVEHLDDVPKTEPAVGDPPSAAAEVPEEDLDLSALLDPHLEGGNGSAETQFEHHAEGAEGRWEDALSLDGLMEDEPGRGHEQAEPNRDHVSQ